jgi:drug/metabolite transporter (DMT)-like permease
MNQHGIVLALVSAALFGVSTPAAKALLGEISPTILAGLFYCGAGVGIAILRRARANNDSKARLGRTELPWLGAAILSGGVIGPLLLMTGLSVTDAATASLLLTLEGVATALMAWFVFGENFDARVAFGMVCLAAGALVLSWTRVPTFSGLLGPLAIAGACVAWGLDNNLTRKVSLSDPLQIVQFKGLTAGPFLLALGLLAGDALPGLTMAAVAGTIGFLGPVRGGPATARCCPDRCLFLDRAVPGRCRGHPVPARATDLPVAGGRSSDGYRCLAAPN